MRCKLARISKLNVNLRQTGEQFNECQGIPLSPLQRVLALEVMALTEYGLVRL